MVLAAGGSTRTAPRFKLLEPIDGVPMVRHAVAAAVDAGLGPVRVVTGHRAPEVEAVLPHGVDVVRHAGWAEGMASSLRAGLADLPAGTDRVLIALGDMPFVQAADHRAVGAAWRPDTVVFPVHAGRRGHPVAWPVDLVPAMCALTGDRGARTLAANARVIEVPVDHAGVHIDLDDPDDLARARG